MTVYINKLPRIIRISPYSKQNRRSHLNKTILFLSRKEVLEITVSFKLSLTVKIALIITWGPLLAIWGISVQYIG